jgi:hypothetical protein
MSNVFSEFHAIVTSCAIRRHKPDYRTSILRLPEGFPRRYFVGRAIPFRYGFAASILLHRSRRSLVLTRVFVSISGDGQIGKTGRFCGDSDGRDWGVGANLSLFSGHFLISSVCPE